MDKLAFDMANKFYDVSIENFTDKKVGVIGITFRQEAALFGVLGLTVVFAIPALFLLGKSFLNMVKRYKEFKEVLAEHPELRNKPLKDMTVNDVVKGGLKPDHVTTFRHVSSAEKCNPLRRLLEEERAKQHAAGNV